MAFSRNKYQGFKEFCMEAYFRRSFPLLNRAFIRGFLILGSLCNYIESKNRTFVLKLCQCL